MPYPRTMNLQGGTIKDTIAITERTLSDLKGFFADQAAEESLLAQNPFIYDVFEASDNPAAPGQPRYSITVIRRGKIDDDYSMTRGHYHTQCRHTPAR